MSSLLNLARVVNLIFWRQKIKILDILGTFGLFEEIFEVFFLSFSFWLDLTLNEYAFFRADEAVSTLVRLATLSPGSVSLRTPRETNAMYELRTFTEYILCVHYNHCQLARTERLLSVSFESKCHQ